MADQLQLKVSLRNLFGRKVKQLRRDGIVPGNIYGKNIKSVAVSIDRSALIKTYTDSGETNLVYLTLDKDTKTRPVLITNLHTDPVTDDPLHVDFHQVDLTQKVTTTVPLEIVGQSPAVKEKDGVLNQAFLEVEAEALPADLPDKIEVDISGLANIGDSIHVKDIPVSAKVKILLDPDVLIASVIQQEEEKEEEQVVDAEAAPETAQETESPSPNRSPDQEPSSPQQDKAKAKAKASTPKETKPTAKS